MAERMHKWERLPPQYLYDSNSSPGLRMRVPGGWIYKLSYQNEQPGYVFVPATPQEVLREHVGAPEEA